MVIPDSSPGAAAPEPTPARITAEILFETRSVLLRPDDPFTLTSGRKSPVYIDCRRLIAFPRARRRLMELAVSMIETHIGYESLDIVAGGETAGIPFAAWISERLMLPMCYVRKQPKGFGRMARIEGDMQPGARVLLVEDLATDGGSKRSFVEALREAGGHCGHCFVIFHYGIFPEATRDLAALGITLHALATWWDVLACAKARGDVDARALASLESFLKDPDGWAPP